MKPILSLIVIAIVFNIAVLWAADAPKPAVQTREDVYIMIKEELILTVDIYKAQVQILSMILDLEQKDLNKQNADLSAQIENLRMLKLYEGKTNESQIALLQQQLDTTRSDLSSAYTNLEELNAKLKETEAKILDYYAKTNALAQQLITDVQKDKDPKLPAEILKSMQANYAVMKKANVTDGMDEKAFEGFRQAASDYVKFVTARGGDVQNMEYNNMLMGQYFASGQANQKQYVDLKLYITSFQNMLDSEGKDKADLQRRLDELRLMKSGKTYDDKIYFASGSVELDAAAVKTLKQFAASVPEDDEYEIMITGFCDNTPIGATLKKTYASNWELSLARSSTVVRYMLGTLNFPPEKIIIAGKGEFSGAQNSTEADKKLSRRVEFRFVPKDIAKK